MKTFVATLLIALLTASAPGPLWAHGGGHKVELKKEETTLPKLPDTAIGMKTNGLETIDYGMGDPMDTFKTEEVGSGPLWEGEQLLNTREILVDSNKMSEHEGHDMSQMKHVKPAEHEWIATSQKGYGWAAALTLFSGVLFGFLTFRRPCE